MTTETFSIKTESFEGPLDLLLTLIEKRKLSISDVSLAKITDDYIEHIKQNENASIKQNAHFILIASTLLLIKSKSLLPNLELSDEEQHNIEDLERRLKIFKIIKDNEHNISDLFGKNPSFLKEGNYEDVAVFAPPKNMSLSVISEAILSIIKSLPKKENLPKKVVQKIVSLEETIVNLTNRIQKSISMSFKDFANVGKEEKVNIVVSFLAMLELVKQGIIEVTQNNHFGDIEMQTKVFETPNYS